MKNLTYKKDNIEDITVNVFKDAIQDAYISGHNSFAPMGCNGDDYILHSYGGSRNGEVSVRLHSGDVKLFITDRIGTFLFYGGYDIGLLPVSFIAEEYFRILQNVKHLIPNDKKSSGVSESDKEKMFKQAQLLIYSNNGIWLK